MIVAGWADGYRNNSFRTVAALAERRGPPPTARRPLGARRRHAPRCPVRGSTSTWSWPPGSTAGCAAWRDGAVTDATATCSCAPRPGPRPTSTCTRAGGCGCRRCRRRRPTASRWTARASWRCCPTSGTARLDRLRRPPALGTVGRPAPRRRPVADLGLEPPRGAGRRPAGGPAAAGGRRARGVAVGQAVRRLRRRHLGPGRPGHPRPGLPRRRARRSVAARARARSTTSRSSSTPAPTPWRRATGCGSASPASDWPNTDRAAGAGHPDRARRRRWTLPCSTATSPRRSSSPAPSTPRSPSSGIGLGGPRRRAAPDHVRRHPHGRDYADALRRDAREDYLGEVSVDRRTFAQPRTPRRPSS